MGVELPVLERTVGKLLMVVLPVPAKTFGLLLEVVLPPSGTTEGRLPAKVCSSLVRTVGKFSPLRVTAIVSSKGMVALPSGLEGS